MDCTPAEIAGYVTKDEPSGLQLAAQYGGRIFDDLAAMLAGLVLMATAGLGACVTAQLGSWVAGGPVPSLAVAGLSLGWLLWINRGGARSPGT